MAKVTLDKNGLAKTAGTMTIYNFDAVSGEYTGSSDEFLPHGVGLPASASTAAPPQTEAGSVAIYRNGEWLVVADHRGETVYSVTDGTAIVINAPGDYMAGTTTFAPVTVWDKWDGEKWVTDINAQQDAAARDATKEKASLISYANSITQAWQAQLMLGIITSEDKTSLTAWMKYIQAVQATDVSRAPDIVWPDKPE